jgi:hypothetical protein
MTDPSKLITVFRSAEPDAAEEVEEIGALLEGEGLHPVVVSGDSPGVVAGSFEVQVPADESARADQAIAAVPELEEAGPGDPTHDLDLVTVTRTDGTTGEMEATAVKSILESNGINSFVVGAPSIPTLGFEVKVAREDVPLAEAAIAAAKAAGPEGALEAEQAGEAASTN